MLDLFTAVDLYMSHVAAEKGLSRNSVESYGRDMREFLECMSRLGRQHAVKITREDIVGFLDAMRKRGLAVSSRARSMSAVRGFFKYLLRENLIETNPVRDLRSGRC